jgi:LysR family glycine cleavage system transcriptional activator
MTMPPPAPKPAQRQKLPPLNGLRAFEAVARLGSFVAAAEELYVTPAAISQQIKTLEGWLGLVLFDRHAQGVTLTDAGRNAVADLTRAFDLMGGAVGTLLRKASPLTIRIASLPSVAHLWLAPRLGALRAAVPDLRISVTTRETPPNLMREPFDLSLFVLDPIAGEGTLIVAPDEIFPVCTPEIAARLAAPSDLNHETLLCDDSWLDDWMWWNTRTSAGLDLEPSGPVFSLYGLALEEAKHGAGVLMGHGFLVEEQLASGTLVAPFPKRVPLSQNLCLRLGKPRGQDQVIDKIVDALLAG